MNTFLPYPDFGQSAKCLDRQRLGKQRVEAMQILNMLLRTESHNWQRHPAVRMWAGFERALWCYGIAICDEWRSRGYKDTVRDKLRAQSKNLPTIQRFNPLWLGCDAFHASHRSNLLRKYPEWYEQFGWNEPPDLPYVWPVERTSVSK